MSSVVLLTGPVFLGNSFNWGLLGILLLQVHQFYTSFPNERFVLKALVAFLLLAELIHAGLITVFAWDYMVGGWGNPQALTSIPPAGLAQPILTGIISGVVQLYYAWRIWFLKRDSILAKVTSALIAVVALLGSITSIVAGIMFCFVKDIAGELRLTSAVQTYLSAGVAADVLIAISMATILIEARRNSPFKETEKLITKLVIDSVETGAITAVTAAVDLILFLHLPGTNLHLCPSLILSQLYSNTVLAALNRRRVLFNGGSYSKASHSSQAYTPGESHQLGLRSRVIGPARTDVEHNADIVHVSTVTDVQIDDQEYSKHKAMNSSL